jgi:D-glycero-D-manno-heptose 1,7-bisphosphate phosphatase
MTTLPRQCAVLVGGKGTRLGSLTMATPKPLLDCGGRPFIAWILRELSRFGIEEFILLTGHLSDQLQTFAAELSHFLPKPATIKLSCEPLPAGTGGALWHARTLFDHRFLVVNGDSWCDTNLARFMADAASPSHALGHILLTQVEDASRYGIVQLSGPQVVRFHDKPQMRTPGTINAGMYILHKDILDLLGPVCSLEQEVLPRLANLGRLTGTIADGYFIDIGIPNDYARASVEIPKRLRRPAVFFNRDSILNEDLGCASSQERLHWVSGAKDAVRAVTDAGLHAFIVTTQAENARDHYAEHDVIASHHRMLEELLVSGGTVDDLRFFPTRPKLSASRGDSNQHKPEPGVIVDLVQRWEVETRQSFLVSDKEIDLQAAAAADIPGYYFSGGDLYGFVTTLLTS